LQEPLTGKLEQLVQVWDVVRIEEHVRSPFQQQLGRHEYDRRSLARAFVAKAVYNLTTTQTLIDLLESNRSLRRLCGFEQLRHVPSAATFSRAFAEFAATGLGDRVHEALVSKHIGKQVVMHVSRDSTAVVARERAARKQKPAEGVVRRKRGRPRKGEQVPSRRPKRLPVQLEQSARQALADLPKVCDLGAKRDTLGHLHIWKGWKAHIDWADGNIPITVVTTSASLHDSQVAIPMAKLTGQRIVSLYDLMDSAYDAEPIRSMSEQLGHVAIIEPNHRATGSDRLLDPAMRERFRHRTTAERGNSRLKDEFGLRNLRVRGHAKAHLHIMFGVIALFADQLLKPFTG